MSNLIPLLLPPSKSHLFSSNLNNRVIFTRVAISALPLFQYQRDFQEQIPLAIIYCWPIFHHLFSSVTVSNLQQNFVWHHISSYPNNFIQITQISLSSIEENKLRQRNNNAFKYYFLRSLKAKMQKQNEKNTHTLCGWIPLHSSHQKKGESMEVIHITKACAQALLFIKKS